eukprot:3836990-Ditylum_brightwellii.AAC.1
MELIAETPLDKYPDDAMAQPQQEIQTNTETTNTSQTSVLGNMTTVQTTALQLMVQQAATLKNEQQPQPMVATNQQQQPVSMVAHPPNT